MEERVIETILVAIQKTNPKSWDEVISFLKKALEHYATCNAKNNLTTTQLQFNNNTTTIQDNMTTINNNLTTIQDNTTTIQDNMTTIQDNLPVGFMPNLSGTASMLENMIKQYKPKLEEVMETGRSWLRRAFDWVWGGVKSIFTSVKNFFCQYIDNLFRAFEAVRTDLDGAFSKAVFIGKSIFSDVVGFIKSNPITAVLGVIGTIVGICVFPFVVTVAKVSAISYAALSLAPLLLTLV